MGNKSLCMNCFGRGESKEEPNMIVKVEGSAPIEAVQVSLFTDEDRRLVEQVNGALHLILAQARSVASADPDLELIVEKDHCRVYGKDTPRGFLLRSEWFVPYAPEKFIKFLGDLDRRKVWDKNMESVKCIKTITDDIGVYYQTYKKIFMLAQRDLLYVSRMVNIGDTWIDTSTSIEHTDFPERKDIVRMKLFLGGYYAEPLVTPVEGRNTKVTCVSECSFGGSVPKVIVKKVCAITIPTYVKDLAAAIEDWLGS